MTMASGTDTQTILRTKRATIFEWDYDIHHASMDFLYENAKRDQWNVTTDLDWDREVDRTRDILDLRLLPIYGTSLWDSMSDSDREELAYKGACWRLSQFLHGEQGSLLVSAVLVNEVPDMDAKMCASAQVIDEARHVEAFRKYIHMVDRIYPIDPTLEDLLRATLEADMWQKKFIGMHILIEGLALAAFKLMRETTKDPLLRDLLSRVLLDEARHVGFGYLALRNAVNELADRERRDLEDFTYMACSALISRKNAAGEWQGGFLSVDQVYQDVGVDPDEVRTILTGSREDASFNRILFTENIIPAINHLGLFTDKIRREYEQLGVIRADEEVRPLDDGLRAD